MIAKDTEFITDDSMKYPRSS